MATSQVSKIRTEQLSHSLGSGSASTEDSLADITTLEVSNFSLDSPSQGRRGEVGFSVIILIRSSFSFILTVKVKNQTCSGDY